MNTIILRGLITLSLLLAAALHAAPIDRHALVREELLFAKIHGHTIPPQVQDAYEAFLAGDIDLTEMQERKSRESV